MLKWLAALFFGLICVIVLIANAGLGGRYFGLLFQLPYGDKIGHFFLMGTFSLLVNLALGARTVRFGRFTPLLGTLIVLFIVTLEEFSQNWVDTRTFSLLDLAFDWAGIWVFGRIAAIICHRLEKRQH
jgi:VanZ family protein